MALTDKLKSAAGAAKDKITGALTPAKLEKARIEIIEDPGANAAASAAGKKTVTVQFNPSEYTIERRVRHARRNPIGGNGTPEQRQVPAGDAARLTVALYFDTITDLHSLGLSDAKKALTGGKAGLKSLAVDQFWRASNDNPAEAAAALMQLVKFASKSHQPPQVNFLWGALDFIGKVESASAQYTMFSPAGVPVRAKVTLVIVGEEREKVQQARQMQPESPDRTKERTLAQGDQLWMIAGQEYDDPAQWKVIAEANGILNPRKLERAAVLKVPSIK